jgi:hypothetical protein
MLTRMVLVLAVLIVCSAQPAVISKAAAMVVVRVRMLTSLVQSGLSQCSLASKVSSHKHYGGASDDGNLIEAIASLLVRVVL